MKRKLYGVSLIIVLCLMFTVVFSTVAYAAELDSATKHINTSGEIELYVSDSPKYFDFDIEITSGVGYGVIQVMKPDGSYYNNFVEFSGDTSVRKRVYFADAGRYVIEVSLAASANVTVTISD